MTTFITIISGVAVFVIGQIFLRVFIEPWQEYLQLKGKLSSSLTYYANVYSNPGCGKFELNDEARNETRKLASELDAIVNKIIFYDFFSYIRLFPERERIIAAKAALIGLSNSTFVGDPLENNAKIKKIIVSLDLKFRDDEV